ncbi:MAG: ROK family protein [Ardenticatenaceae bacterium]|nr:ROK family protein [Ardenticatenaceae bacterium]
MDKWILAFDFGGTKLSAALLSTAALQDARPIWSAQRRVYSPADGDAQYDIQTMTALGRELLGERTATAVGVSFGGPVDYETGVVRLSHHVPGWDDVPLQALLAKEFAAPVRVDNDANVAALGEWRFGAGRGVADLFYLTISTGVGGGWVLNGRSWRGYEGMAGEIGHTVVDPHGPRCLCGKQGCVERLASGPYMAADYQAMRHSTEEASGSPVTGQVVAQLAMAGDETAVYLIQRGAWAIGTGIGNVANLINPQMFVLGGGVTKSGDLWWDGVRQAARATALPQVHFEIVAALLGDDAPLWGAVALVEDLLLTGAV